jgi:hypothetical protein
MCSIKRKYFHTISLLIFIPICCKDRYIRLSWLVHLVLNTKAVTYEIIFGNIYWILMDTYIFSEMNFKHSRFQKSEIRVGDYLVKGGSVVCEFRKSKILS